MRKSNPDKVAETSTDRSPFKDITNSSTIENANVTTNSQEAKKNSTQSCYTRMSDEKKAAFLEKRRMARQQKKAQALNIVNGQQTAEAYASLGSKQCTPLSNITNTRTNDARCTGDSTTTVRQPEEVNVGRKRSGQSWYARLTDDQRAEHLHKLRMARLQKKVVAHIVGVEVPQSSNPLCSPGAASTVAISESTSLPVALLKTKAATAGVNVEERQPSAGEASPGITQNGSTQSSITRVVHTPVGGPNIEEDGSDDWLHRNPTYVRIARSAEHNSNVLQTGGGHGQYDFVPTSFILGRSIEPQVSAARYEKERIRKRTKYSEMSTDQKDALLYRVREYKKRKRTTCASSDQYDRAGATSGSVYPSPCTPATENNHIGGYNIDEDSDAAGIFEPMGPDAEIEGNEFESYRVTADGSHSFETHDPYDYVYKNLPTKHHVLKPVKDCVHCGC